MKKGMKEEMSFGVINIFLSMFLLQCDRFPSQRHVFVAVRLAVNQMIFVVFHYHPYSLLHKSQPPPPMLELKGHQVGWKRHTWRSAVYCCYKLYSPLAADTGFALLVGVTRSRLENIIY